MLELKVVELPGLQKKEDVIDWSKIPGNNKEKLIELRKNTPVWIPTPEPQKNELSLIHLGDLLKTDDEPCSWLLDQMLPMGGFSVLVAKPKVGKSTLARALSLHVAKGQSFLGKEVHQGGVIYLALEEKKSEIKKHFNAMGATGQENIYIYSGSTPVDVFKKIKCCIADLKPVLLIIDPLFRFVRIKDGNDYAQVTQALDPILHLSREHNIHVMLVHHSPKTENGDLVLGSTAIFGSVDSLLVMKRHETCRTLQSTQRYGEDLPESVLNFDKRTKSITIGGDLAEEDLERVEQEILAFLGTQDEPVTEPVITAQVEGRTPLKRKALRGLVDEDRIKRDGQGVRGKPFIYSCSLVPTLPQEQEYENPKEAVNPHGCEPYSRSQDFTKNDSCTGDFTGVENKKNEIVTIEDFEIMEVSE